MTVNIFNMNFSSVVEALLYLGWTDESGKVLPAPERSGNTFLTDGGGYETVLMGTKGVVVWVKEGVTWEKHVSFKGASYGVNYFNNEYLAEVCLRQAIDMEGCSHILLSVWTSDGGGFTNTVLRDRFPMEALVLDEDGDERRVIAVFVEGKIMVFVGSPTNTQQAKQMAYHLLKQ